VVAALAHENGLVITEPEEDYSEARQSTIRGDKHENEISHAIIGRAIFALQFSALTFSTSALQRYGGLDWLTVRRDLENL